VENLCKKTSYYVYHHILAGGVTTRFGFVRGV